MFDLVFLFNRKICNLFVLGVAWRGQASIHLCTSIHSFAHMYTFCIAANNSTYLISSRDFERMNVSQVWDSEEYGPQSFDVGARRS